MYYFYKENLCGRRLRLLPHHIYPVFPYNPPPKPMYYTIGAITLGPIKRLKTPLMFYSAFQDLLRYCLSCVWLTILLFIASCREKMDGENAAYIDKTMYKLEDSLARRGLLSPAEMLFLDSVRYGAKGVGVNQLAHKYIVSALASKSREDRITYADNAISLLENRFSSSEKSSLLFSRAGGIKASGYLRIRNYDEAIRNYTLQKIGLNQIKDSCKHTAYYNNMARLLHTQKKFTEAIPYFKTAAALTEKCRPVQAFAMIQEYLDNIAMCYHAAGSYDSAHLYYNMALDFIEKNKDGYNAKPERAARIPLMKAVVYGNQGDLFLEQGSYEQAEAYQLKSLEITRTKDPVFANGVRLSLLNVFLQTRQLEKAAKMLAELDTTVDAKKIDNFLVDLYKTRSKYFSITGNPALAYSNLTEAFIFSDSIAKRDQMFLSIDVAREFENKEQKSINEALKKDNELQKSHLLIFIISTVLACVIAGLVWYNLKRKSLYVARLKKLNAEIENKNHDLHQTLVSLEASHSENTRLMRAVAHDLRNPVGAIRTLAYSLNNPGLPPEVQEAFLLIQSTCTDSLNLIKDLLEYKKDGAGISKELVDMGRLILQCSQILQIRAGEKNQQLTLQIAHPKIPANREKLYRVISNLVNNAIKFSPEHSEISISLQKKQGSVVVAVKDNGIGIPPALKDKILNMTPESSRKGTAGEESYGLGLAICKQIMQEHNGRLWFESEEGKGSVFFIELPMAR